jgi:small subunit ribosomal protein S17
MSDKVCNDPKCFIHGNVSVRGGRLVGVVVSDKGKNTVVVKIERIKRVAKYHRYERRRSKIHAHNPPCIKAKEGDVVLLGETRKLSKTKAWTVMEVLKRVGA